MRRGLTAGALITGLLATTSVSAQEVLLNGVPVPGSPNVTTQVNLPNDGDVLTVDGGASIVVNGADAVENAALNGFTFTVNNAGTISSTTDKAIDVSGNTLVLTNTGTIEGQFFSVDADDTILMNTGTIRSITSDGLSPDNLTGTNSGNIIGANNAINNSGSNNSVTSFTNTGTIRGGVVNPSGEGINTRDIDNLINSGTIMGGSTGNGLQANDVLSNSRNSGLISGGKFGIEAEILESFTNSGTIIGGTRAIEEFGSGDSLLTLLAGSNIQGLVNLGGGTNTLNVGAGLNMATTFVGAAPVIGTTNGAPVVINGNQVIVVDVTGFATTDEILTDVTRSITGAVEGHLEAQRACHRDHRTDMGDVTVTPVADLPAMKTTCGTGMWGTIFGGYSRLVATHESSQLENGFGGVMMGYDTSLSEETVGGVFAVFAKGEAITPNDNYSNDMTSGYGGAYVSHAAGPVVFDLSVLAGVMNSDQDRLVNNNLVAGGLEVAAADYDGIAFSPSLRMSFEQGLGGSTLTPSVRVRYAGLYLDNYRETGSAVNLAVGDRDVHVVEVRGELALAVDSHEVESGFWHTQLKGGVDGIFNWGDHVDATLLGQEIRFEAGEEESIVRGYGGVEAAFASHGGTQFTAVFEAGYDSVETFSADARLGVHVPLETLY